VVNIVNGPGDPVGSTLASHEAVSKLSFTGSTQTGQNVMALASKTLKPITLETGGKSPLIVFKDADIKRAAHWAFLGVIPNTGQMCTATSRMLVHEDVYDEFMQELLFLLEKSVVMGDPFDPHTTVGPLMSARQRDNVIEHITQAIRLGAQEKWKSETWTDKSANKGYFVRPTVLTEVEDDNLIVTEEVFGPVITVSRFSDNVDVLRRANATRYGLAAAVFTKDLSNAMDMAKGLDVGTVWINSSNDSDIRVAFGGTKMSGFGRELGEAALDAYSYKKAIHINLAR